MKREDELLDETIKQLESKHQPEAHQKPLELPGRIERSPKASDSTADLNLTQNEEATFEKLVTYKKTTETVLQKYKDPGQMIDFRGTFRNIQRNPHLLGLMTDQIKCEKRVYGSLLCRTGFLFHCLRLSIYQIIVIVGQYMTTTSVVILIVLEASRIVMTSVLYAKKKHYKQVLLFLLDVSQSVFLFCFLCFAYMYIERDLETDPIPDKQENITIYLVIGATIVEYSLTLMYLMIQACKDLHHYFLTRKVRKYKKNYPMTEFIKTILPEELERRKRLQARQQLTNFDESTDKGLQDSIYLQQNSLDKQEALQQTGIPKSDKQNRILANPLTTSQISKQGRVPIKAVGDKKPKLVASRITQGNESLTSVKVVPDQESAAVWVEPVAGRPADLVQGQKSQNIVYKTKNEVPYVAPGEFAAQEDGGYKPHPSVPSYQRKFGAPKPAYSQLSSVLPNKVDTLSGRKQPRLLDVPIVSPEARMTSDSFREQRNRSWNSPQPEQNNQQIEGGVKSPGYQTEATQNLARFSQDSRSDWNIRNPGPEEGRDNHNSNNPTREDVEQYRTTFDSINVDRPSGPNVSKLPKYSGLKITIPENGSTTSPQKSPGKWTINPQDSVGNQKEQKIESPSRQTLKLLSAFGGSPRGGIISVKAGALDDEIVKPVSYMFSPREENLPSTLRHALEERHYSDFGTAKEVPRSGNIPVAGPIAQFANEMEAAGLKVPTKPYNRK